MRNLSWASVFFALTLTAACAAPAPEPVFVSGTPEDLAALAGEWVGEYSSGATGRRGSIRLTLEADGPAAFGDVVMYPADATEPLTPANREMGAEPKVPELLAIRFVSVSGGLVSGTLEPYRDPQCGCILSTTFTGRIAGDTVEGTFVSHGGPVHLVVEGRWRVVRRGST
jgi:hypothetical protein